VIARALLLLVALAPLAGCEREQRHFSAEGHNATQEEAGARLSTNQPAVELQGGVRAPTQNVSMYDDNAFAVSQGKRLFRWYNCAGCHANGGGGIGPPLMDREWKYGSDPASIFASIMQGRPEGMPSFGGHIPEDQAWQLVAYVRSMAGMVRQDVAPSRGDTLFPGEPENARAPMAAPKGRAP
jgi:cytochrome c oxidase cbb3-type subunit 3